MNFDRQPLIGRLHVGLIAGAMLAALLCSTPVVAQPVGDTFNVQIFGGADTVSDGELAFTEAIPTTDPLLVPFNGDGGFISLGASQTGDPGDTILLSTTSELVGDQLDLTIQVSSGSSAGFFANFFAEGTTTPSGSAIEGAGFLFGGDLTGFVDSIDPLFDSEFTGFTLDTATVNVNTITGGSFFQGDLLDPGSIAGSVEIAPDGGITGFVQVLGDGTDFSTLDIGTAGGIAPGEFGGFTVSLGLTLTAVPEPATGFMALIGIAGVCARRRRNG